MLAPRVFDSDKEADMAEVTERARGRATRPPPGGRHSPIRSYPAKSDRETSSHLDTEESSEPP